VIRLAALPFALLLGTPAAAAEPLSGAQKIARAQAYAAAVGANDYAAARRLLSPSARVWYEKREGDGEPLSPGAGRWTHWDTFFHGRTTYAEWRVEGDAVVATAHETNDFYRLLDWRPHPMRFTWWLDGSGAITGFMVQATPGDTPTGSRLKDAVAWAKKAHPQEITYLMPTEKIDPTEDRAERWRKLLSEWRRQAGLPAIELGTGGN